MIDFNSMIPRKLSKSHFKPLQFTLTLVNHYYNRPHVPIINCHACQIKVSIVNIAIPNFPAFVTITCYTIFIAVKLISML